MANEIQDVFGGRAQEEKLAQAVKDRRASHGRNLAQFGLRGEHLAKANMLTTLLDVGLSKWGNAGAKGMATDTQKAQIDAQKEYAKRMQVERQKGGALDPEVIGSGPEAQLKQLEIASSVAYDNGLPGKGLELAAQASQLRKQHERAGLEFEKLEQDVEMGKRSLDRDKKYGDDKAGANQFQTVYVKDPETGEYSPMPQDAYMTADGAQIGEQVYGPGEFTTYDVSRLINANTPAEKEKERRMLLQATVPKAKVAEIQEQAVALDKQIKITNRVMDIFDEATGEGRDINFTGGAGRGLAGMRRMADNIQSTVRELGGTYRAQLGKDKDASMNTWLKKPENKSIRKDIDKQVKEFAKETGKSADEVRALTLELAYATARANEPGARQLSDADISYALQMVGGNLTSPENMRDVFAGNLTRSIEAYNARREGIDPRVRGMVVHDDLNNRLNDSIGGFNDRISNRAQVGQASRIQRGTDATLPQVATSETPSGAPALTESSAAKRPSEAPALTAEQIDEAQAYRDSVRADLWVPN